MPLLASAHARHFSPPAVYAAGANARCFCRVVLCSASSGAHLFDEADGRFSMPLRL
jgi:hypothetical protein